VAGYVFTILYFLVTTLYHVLGRKTPPQVLKTSLNNPRLFPWIDAHTPRLYVYSKKDELVPWEEVEEHVSQAKALGINVKAEVFAQSPHVGHARMDPAKYWSAVGEAWATACDMES
jgi:hypothetical protein